MTIEQYADLFDALMDNIERVIVGKREAAQGCLIGLLSGGHVLLEDVPGVGKTMMAKTLARSIGVHYKRIQFTPDLLPSDITGSLVYDQNESTFRFREGPVFSHVLLADEINRAGPKTQAALLECMEENTVTADVETHALPDPFFVIATQNPAEYEGVYPLPESQLDRFALRLSIGYPSPQAELALMKQQRLQHPIEELGSVADVTQIRAMQNAAREVSVHDRVYDYVLRLAASTRNNPDIAIGLSPRGSLALVRAAQALAASRRRDYVTIDDVKDIAEPVIAHRLIAHPEARYDDFQSTDFVRETLAAVPVE